MPPEKTIIERIEVVEDSTRELHKALRAALETFHQRTGARVRYVSLEWGGAMGGDAYLGEIKTDIVSF